MANVNLDHRVTIRIGAVEMVNPSPTGQTFHRYPAYLGRRHDTFTNPLVYTLWGNHGPSIMTMSAALAE